MATKIHGALAMTNNSSSELESDFPAGIGSPARRALAGAGYTWLEQLTKVSEAELRKLHGMGPKALGLLRSALAARGQSFADASGTPGEQRE